MGRARSTIAFLCLIAACSAGVERGIVVDVVGDLTSVASFTVLTTTGERLTIIPEAGREYDFPLPHLRSHLQTGEPVAFTYDERDGQLFLIAIDDG